jgi:hypothetical protein
MFLSLDEMDKRRNKKIITISEQECVQMVAVKMKTEFCFKMESQAKTEYISVSGN